MGVGNNNGNGGGVQSDNIEFTITEVVGYSYTYDEDDEVKTSYDLSTSALFNNVPSDLKGYMIKTTYYGANNDRIGQQTNSLEEIFFDSDDFSFPYSFGYYTSYNKLEPEYVVVEIIKSGNVITNDTFEVDKNKIEYL